MSIYGRFFQVMRSPDDGGGAGNPQQTTPPAQESNPAQQQAQTQSEQQPAQQQSAAQAVPPAKTFTQDDVNRIVKERLARAKLSFEDEDGKKPTAGQPDNSEIDDVKNELYTAKVETALTAAGVEEKWLDKAMRLIDKSECLNDKGYPDAGKIKKAVADLAKDMPMLKKAAQDAGGGQQNDGGGQSRQKWGSPQTNPQGQQLSAEDALRAAFGLKKT